MELKLRCRFQVEHLRRMMTKVLDAFPEVWEWEPKWENFENALAQLTYGQENIGLDFHVAYLHLALDCIETSRRRLQHQHFDLDSSGATAQPALFLFDANRDGLAHLKSCSKLVARVWAYRRPSITSSGGGSMKMKIIGKQDEDTNARVCNLMLRELGVVLEAIMKAGRLEGYQSVADELGLVVEEIAAARCMAGLVRSLRGRPFYDDLASCCESWRSPGDLVSRCESWLSSDCNERI